MNNFFNNLRYKLARFMQGRYGSDQLNICLLVIAIFIMIIEMIFPTLIMSLVSWVLLFLVFFRTLSRNHAKRAAENQKFLQVSAGPKRWFNKQNNRYINRKTKKYFKCPKCRQSLCVPKGKGRIRVVCPKCGTEIFKNT